MLNFGRIDIDQKSIFKVHKLNNKNRDSKFRNFLVAPKISLGKKRFSLDISKINLTN